MPNTQPDLFETLHTDERIYPETFWLQIRDGMFYMALRSGQHSKVFASNLVFAKRLARMILRQIEDFEKANNIQVEGTLPDEPVRSPIQASDNNQK